MSETARSSCLPLSSGADWPSPRVVRRVFVALALGALLSLWIDIPLARWCRGDNSPRAVREALETAEAFGNGYGVGMILVAVWLLDRASRARVVRLVAVVVGCGIGSNVLKLCIARTRPRDFGLDTASVFDTFTAWLPLLHSAARSPSFPSAHTAGAFGLAVALSWAYPRGRALFFALAVMVGLQRVQVGAHFASDAFAGAAIGWLIACYLTRRDALGGVFARLEAPPEVENPSAVGAAPNAIPLQRAAA